MSDFSTVDLAVMIRIVAKHNAAFADSLQHVMATLAENVERLRPVIEQVLAEGMLEPISPEHNYRDLGAGMLIDELLATIDWAISEYEG